MKPAWDKLMKDYDGMAGTLVADVDCDGDGRDLCEKHDIEGYPTVKWGDPSDLVDYEGEREYDDMKKFAEENLKPMCSPANFELCDEEKKSQISDFRAMGSTNLESKVKQVKKQMKKVSSDFDKRMERLEEEQGEVEEELNELEKKKKDKISETKRKTGFPLMQAVLEEKGNTTKDEL
mmetsp:Transcript_90791/g.180536  ORF Transcript_90791/g.180536 Transcript_90791/m.180536 type:complete len:178 (-) Transcript_90791:86-619(-)